MQKINQIYVEDVDFAAENIFNGYYKSFFNNKIGAASVRAGNVIGGGDWSNDRLIPDCIKAIKDKKKNYYKKS